MAARYFGARNVSPPLRFRAANGIGSLAKNTTTSALFFQKNTRDFRCPFLLPPPLFTLWINRLGRRSRFSFFLSFHSKAHRCSSPAHAHVNTKAHDNTRKTGAPVKGETSRFVSMRVTHDRPSRASSPHLILLYPSLFQSLFVRESSRKWWMHPLS